MSCELFNTGEGAPQFRSVTAFIKWNMPLEHGGNLSDQEAYDIVACLAKQSQPELVNKQDWPKGGHPDDTRY